MTTQTLFPSRTQIQMHVCMIKNRLVCIPRYQENTAVGSLCISTRIVRTGFSSRARTACGTHIIRTDQQNPDILPHNGPNIREVGRIYGGAKKDMKVSSFVIFIIIEGMNIEDMGSVFVIHSIFRKKTLTLIGR